MDLELDAIEPLRQIYREYLDERFRNNPAEKRHRAERFENGFPDLKDEAKLKAGQSTYLQSVNNGDSQATATDKARDAFLSQHHRELLMAKEVDPNLYQKNKSYADRKDKEIDEKVQKQLQERKERLNTSNTNQEDHQNDNPRKR